MNAQELWTATFDVPYVYGEPFDWMLGLEGFVGAAREVPFTMGALPAMIGLIIGSMTMLVLWSGSRGGSDVVARTGVARTFQNIRLFTEMSLVENVLVGMDYRLRTGFWSALLRLPQFGTERLAARRASIKLLRFVGLESRKAEAAGSLSYGHRRRLEIARALASDPRILLLDEPAAGMNPQEISELMELIRSLRDRGITVVLIEHHMKLVMGISDRIAVLQYGRKIAEGTPEEVRCNPRCVEAYLGADEGVA
ncbi:MAG: ABC transporter ATP-binding protein [Phycisphaerales bacterium]|nr:ABC transporter ATP-binding protein [Phycisphaerales bacterium]